MPKGKTGGGRGRPKNLTLEETDENIGTPPPSLSIIGKDLWGHIGRSAPWLNVSDRYAVLELCKAFERREYINMMFDLGILKETQEIERQGRRATPEVAMVKDLTVSISTMMREMGLNPMGRQGIADNKNTNEDPIDSYFSRMSRRSE